MSSGPTAERPLPADAASLADAAHDWKAAYVHIPFCRRRCPYCDFAIVDESDGPVDIEAYADAVIAEIALENGIGTLDAVNFGGGTPSRMAPRDLGRIIEALASAYGLAPDVEISMEVNPEDWTAAIGQELAGIGITRVSLGAQSMDGVILGVLGRLHGVDDVRRVIGDARSIGIGSVGVDLIFGHPNETEVSWDATVAAALELQVDHISTYALTVEPGTALSRSILDGGAAPDDDVQADRYHRFIEESGSAGFRRYEVSNHARDGHHCRYNLATWAHAEYLGFGLGAHDHRWGERSRNHRRLDRYLECIAAGERPRLGTERLDRRQQDRDRLMLGLRLAAGTPLTGVAAEFLESEPARTLEDHALIRRDEGRIVVADPMLADAVAREALSVLGGDC